MTEIAAVPSLPTVRLGGVRGAADELAARRAQHVQRVHRVAFNDHHVGAEDKGAKLRRARDLLLAATSATA